MDKIVIERIPRMEANEILAAPFKKMPILYLEIIENKLRIKPDVINKPYDPPKSMSIDIQPNKRSTVPKPDPIKYIDKDEASIEEEQIEFDEDADMDNHDTEYNEADDFEEDKEISENLDGRSEKNTIDQQDSYRPPTLIELQALHPEETILKKEYKYPHSDDEATAKRRNEVYFQYQVLKRMHPSAPIPEFTMYSDPELMGKKYDMLAKNLSLDSSVENWKRYMIIFVMGLEVVLGKLSFDVEGFAQQQLVQMSTYDSLLVEMAEKSYTPNGKSKWPVEIRLLMLLTVNMTMFIVCRMIQKRTGTNLLGSINQQLNHGQDERLMRTPPES